MVKLFLALSLLGAPLQQAPEVTIGIRPTAVRVGETALLSVRIVTAGLPSDEVELLPGGGVQVVDVQDRQSTHVIPGGNVGYAREVVFELVAVDPGEHSLPPVRVSWQGTAFDTESPKLSVHAAPLAWGTPRRRTREDVNPGDDYGNRRERRTLPEDVPPPEGELREALPHPNPGLTGGVLYPGAMGMGAGAFWSSFPGQYPQALPVNPWGYPYGAGYPGGYPLGANGGFYPGMYPGGYPGGYLSGYPGGVPPDTTGAIYPGGVPGVYPPGSGYGSPWAPMSGYPMGGYPMGGGGYPMGGGGYPWGWGGAQGGGWSATASSDPWWPELVPELFNYQSVGRDAEGLVTISAGLTPGTVYVGQQVTYVATTSFAPGALLRLGADHQYLPPTPEGFWIVDLPELGSGTPAAGQGDVLQAYTFRRALFPLESGSKLIPPARIVSPNRTSPRVGGVSADMDVAAATDPLPVVVLPIPLEGAPEGFNGAVGRYRVEAHLTPNRVAVGETSVLTVRILGAGNVQSLPQPEIGLFPEVEMAPFSDWAMPEVQEGVLGGVKTFNWLVVPRVAGWVRLGPILYPYFDPYVGGFGLADSQELVLQVTELPQGGGG